MPDSVRTVILFIQRNFPLFSLCEVQFSLWICVYDFCTFCSIFTILSIRARMVIVEPPHHMYVCVHAFNISHVMRIALCIIRACVCVKWNLSISFKLFYFYVPSTVNNLRKRSLFRKTVQHMRIPYVFMGKLKSNRANRNAVVAVAAAAAVVATTTTSTPLSPSSHHHHNHCKQRGKNLEKRNSTNCYCVYVYANRKKDERNLKICVEQLL